MKGGAKFLKPTVSPSLSGQMGIPKPPASLHLSPTSHHWFTPLFHPICSHHLQLLTLIFSVFLYHLMAFSLSTPVFLHHLTRFSCFLDTWAISTRTILHHHNLLQPEFHSLHMLLVLSQDSDTHTSALSNTSFDHQPNPKYNHFCI